NSGTAKNTYGITVNSGATLDVSGIVSSSAASDLFKEGPGTLKYSGSAANAVSGRTFVQEGTLQLNKLGTVSAIVGPLVVGDSIGVDNADQVTFGPQAGAVPGLSQGLNQIADGAAAPVTVLSSGKFDLSGANAYAPEVQLLTFPAGTTDGS